VGLVDGIARQGSHLGCPGGVHPVQADQLEGLVGFGSDLLADNVQDGLEKGALEGAVPGLLGVFVRLSRVVAGRRVRGILVLAGLAAAVKGELLADDGEQPVAEPAPAGVVAKNLPLFEHAAHGLLDDLLGGVVGASLPAGEQEHAPPVAVEELSPGQRVAGVGESFKQSGLCLRVHRRAPVGGDAIAAAEKSQERATDSAARAHIRGERTHNHVD